MNKYRLLPALSLFVLAACGGKEKKKPAPAGAGRGPVAVNVFVLKTSPLSETVEVPGTLIANESTEIYPEIAGRVTQLNIAEGKQVTRGALLVKLFDGDLQATLRKLQVQLEIAKQNEDRSAQLLKIQGISKADYDASVLNVNNIQADIAITRANITKTEIRAPFSGRIGLKNISPGAYVSPSTVIASIQQTSTLKLDFTVPEKYTSRIKVGQLVHFTNESTSKTYTAKVMATEAGVTLDTRSLTARCIVQEKDPQLVPGSFAKVRLDFDPIPDAIMVPSQAIVPQARGKQVILFNGGVAKFIDVNTGIRDSASVQITSGVKAGDTIVVSGLMSTKPGSQLKVGKIVSQDGTVTQVTKDTTVKKQQPAK
ncbi:efflux RND transporter periplasmic adaptor subunit [Nostoc ellipsosporum NOK]|nr:efflux RND transporter periplasmic adaptor subunit [Nostoc ellipsosporum NOK]